MLGLIVVFAHLGFSYIRIFGCGFVFVIVAAARTQRLPLKVCTHPLKCESFCATGGLAIQISIKCDQYSYLSDTHADHKVLYHLRGSGTSILYPLSFTLNSLRSFEIKSKAGAERVQLLPESDKIFITLCRTLSACGHRLRLRLFGPELRILVRTWRLFRVGSPGHNVLLMTSSAPAFAAVVVVDDAYCVSHKKQAEKIKLKGSFAD